MEIKYLEINFYSIIYCCIVGEILVFRWPNNFRMALSLTFDDGLSSQLNIAIPLLDKYGFKGTFYLNPRDREMLRRWREVSERGHEIGNHTLTHPCSCNFSGDPHGRCLENMTLEDIRRDIVEAHRRIREAIPNGSRTFAYPCYETYVGRGLNRKSYVPIVAEIFIAARNGFRYPNSPEACDLHFLWSWEISKIGFEKMIGYIVRTFMEGKWAIFTFHGIDEGHLSTSKYDFERLLIFLDKYREKIWIAPLVDVAEYIAEKRGY